MEERCSPVRPMESPVNSLSTLAHPKHFRARRVSVTSCRLPADGREVLANIQGAGEIVHIWMAVDSGAEHFLRKMLLRMYWDGETAPSVEAPLGDFFGVGHANERSDDYSSTAYWYQAEPHRTFPEILPARQRLPRPVN